jgi:hypothetical protein
MPEKPVIAPPVAMMKSGPVLSLKVGESTVAIDMGADDFLEWRICSSGMPADALTLERWCFPCHHGNE